MHFFAAISLQNLKKKKNKPHWFGKLVRFVFFSSNFEVKLLQKNASSWSRIINFQQVLSLKSFASSFFATLIWQSLIACIGSRNSSKLWGKLLDLCLNYFCLNIMDLFKFAANFVRIFFSTAFDYFQHYFCHFRFWDQQLCFERFIDFAILSRCKKSSRTLG